MIIISTPSLICFVHFYLCWKWLVVFYFTLEVLHFLTTSLHRVAYHVRREGCSYNTSRNRKNFDKILLIWSRCPGYCSVDFNKNLLKSIENKQITVEINKTLTRTTRPNQQNSIKIPVFSTSVQI